MDSQIAMAISEEELENEIEEALSVQDTISDYKFMILEALKNDQHDKPVSSFHDNNSSTKPTTTRINVNLPKLSIQPFNGNQLEWLTFWDSFSAAIDEHTELNNIEKMNYLQNMLKGEAARAIAGLPLTNENYTKAIEILIGTTSSTVRSQPSDVHHESFTTRKGMRNRLLERLTNCAIVAFIQQKTATIRTHANTQDNANNRDT